MSLRPSLLVKDSYPSGIGIIGITISHLIFL